MIGTWERADGEHLTSIPQVRSAAAAPTELHKLRTYATF